MDFNLIVIVVFVALLVVAGIFTRKAFLDKIVWLPGEVTVLTDDAKFVTYFRGTPKIKEIFLRGHIVVTNKRILFTQKTLWGGRYKIDFAVNYSETGPALTEQDLLGGALFKLKGAGFMTFYTTASRVTNGEDGGKPAVITTIPFPSRGPLLAEPKFVVYTQRGNAYQKIFGGR